MNKKPIGEEEIIMMRYAIINEPNVEISANEFKKYGNIVDAHTANGMQNGTFAIKDIADTLEEAREKLKAYKCSYGKTSGFAGVKFYGADLTYIAEQEWDTEYEEWNDTGDYEYAEVEEV